MKAKESKYAVVRLEKSKLMAAIAVLAVMFAAFAVVMPVSDDADATATAGQGTVNGYTIKFDAGLTVDEKGIFSGSATAGAKIDNNDLFGSSPFVGVVGWSAVIISGFTGAEKYVIKQTNTALNPISQFVW